MTSTRFLRHHSLLIKNLSWMTGSKEVRDYFEAFGKVVKAHIVFDRDTGFSRHHGYITFADKETIKKVFNAPTHKIDKKVIEVSLPD
jgi:RNA recognition motif-containing protein